jgi:DNA-binding SARP family transcriptional activator
VEERLAATNRRIGLELALGRPDDVLPELRELLAAYPLQEPLWEHLVQALHRAGRRGDALEAYGQARAVLRDELGLDPGARLRELHRSVLVEEIPTQRAYAASSEVAELLGRVEQLSGELQRLSLAYARALEESSTVRRTAPTPALLAHGLP